MDPISILFAAYLDFVSNDIQQTVVDVLGGEPMPVTIEYEGVHIPFQYQFWNVREETVCARYKPNMCEYSPCTIEAKVLFEALCHELSESQEEHWKYIKIKSMYCNAAISFEPTIATISSATDESPRTAAKQKCNVAVAYAIGSEDPKVLAERNRACAEYEKLK